MYLLLSKNEKMKRGYGRIRTPKNVVFQEPVLE